MRVAVWTMLPFLGLMPSAWAATFDCNKASTFVEKAICSDSRLTSIDDQLGRLYKDALAASSNSSALKAEQRAWLSSRDQCKDSDCVIKAYEARISSLSAMSSPDKSGDFTGTYKMEDKGAAGLDCSANGKWTDQVLPKRDIPHKRRGGVRRGALERECGKLRR